MVAIGTAGVKLIDKKKESHEESRIVKTEKKGKIEWVEVLQDGERGDMNAERQIRN